MAANQERLTTWAEMLGRVRRAIKDESGALNPDAKVKAAIFDAVLDLARDCPDARLGPRSRQTDLPPDVDAVDWDYSNLPTSAYYDAAVEALACHKILVADASDVKDESLARHWLTRYQQMTRGGG